MSCPLPINARFRIRSLWFYRTFDWLQGKLQCSTGRACSGNNLHGQSREAAVLQGIAGGIELLEMCSIRWHVGKRSETVAGNIHHLQPASRKVFFTGQKTVYNIGKVT
jgi:hypothetical protein